MSGIKTANLQPAQVQQILSEVEKRIQLVLQSPSRLLPGQPLLASIIPTIPQIDVSELVNGLINIAWLEKEVLYKDVKAVGIPSPDSVDASNLNGDSILTNLETSDPNNIIKQPFPLPPLSTTSVTQTPGLASQLAGTITLPRLSVNVKTKWTIYNQAGEEIKDDGKSLIALNGLTGTSVSILLPPVFRELRLDTIANPGGSIFCIAVTVTLSIGDLDHSFTLGRIPVLQIPVLIPTIVALFSEPNFTVTDNSSVVILVPQHSVFSSAAPLFKELRKIEAVLDSLSTIASIAGFLLGLREITSLTDHPRLRFVAANGIPNLDEILLKRKPWYDLLGDDETFNDKTSSLFVFGLPGTRVLFYNRYKFQKNDGFFEIKLKDTVDLTPDELALSPLPDLFVSIRSFPTPTEREMNPALNDASPDTFPAGRIVDEDDDPNSDNVWDNILSSVQFNDDEWLQKVVSPDIQNPQIISDLICAQVRKPRKL